MINRGSEMTVTFQAAAIRKIIRRGRSSSVTAAVASEHALRKLDSNVASRFERQMILSSLPGSGSLDMCK